MTQALPQSTLSDHGQLVPVDPNVKSAIARGLFNAGVVGIDGTSKTADPTCYNGFTQWRKPWEMHIGWGEALEQLNQTSGTMTDYHQQLGRLLLMRIAIGPAHGFTMLGTRGDPDTRLASNALYASRKRTGK